MRWKTNCHLLCALFILGLHMWHCLISFDFHDSLQYDGKIKSGRNLSQRKASVNFTIYTIIILTMVQVPPASLQWRDNLRVSLYGSRIAM